MGNLKHLNISQLYESKKETENTIDHLKKRVSGQETRLRWINNYIRNIKIRESTCTS